MKKIGIITLNGNINLGNRLQNYALQKTLEELNFNVDTLWFCDAKSYIKEKAKKTLFYFTSKRKYNFLNFSNKYIKTKYYLKSNISDKYDYFVAGSDQIWNYNFPDFNENMFLMFSPKEKNISYAASFGIDSIKDEKKDLFKKGLSNFKNISVREDKGKEIVDSLLKINQTEVLIDPTMLLDRRKWEEIMKKPKNIEGKKYILNYFLGTLSEKKKKDINDFAKKNGCEVINILDKKDQFYEYGPSEFLYLVKNAFLICTDSFHSSVFSIIFDRPFIIFDRDDKEEKMNSRIDTLLNKFEIKNRRYQDQITEKNIQHDYSKAYEVLKKEQEKSIIFLKKSLQI